MKMYKVYYFNASSPNELEEWLNTQYEDGLELVAADGGYFIFKECISPN